MAKSKLYNVIKKNYKRKWCTIEQLREYVSVGAITESEFEEICGEKYE